MRPRIGTLLVAAALAATPLASQAQTPHLTLSSELSAAPLLAQTQIPALNASPAAAAVTLPPLEADLDSSYGRPLESSVGLRPSTRSRDSTSLSSGFGLQLYMNRIPEVELAPSGLGLQPKPAPGIIFNKRF